MGKKKATKDEEIEKQIEEADTVVETDTKETGGEISKTASTEAIESMTKSDAETTENEDATEVTEKPSEAAPQEEPEKAEGKPEKKGKKKKPKKEFDPLDDDPMVFKSVSFDKALTKEEKAARKKERLKAKKDALKAEKKANKPEKSEKKKSITAVESVKSAGELKKVKSKSSTNIKKTDEGTSQTQIAKEEGGVEEKPSTAKSKTALDKSSELSGKTDKKKSKAKSKKKKKGKTEEKEVEKAKSVEKIKSKTEVEKSDGGEETTKSKTDLEKKSEIKTKSADEITAKASVGGQKKGSKKKKAKEADETATKPKKKTGASKKKDTEGTATSETDVKNENKGKKEKKKKGGKKQKSARSQVVSVSSSRMEGKSSEGMKQGHKKKMKEKASHSFTEVSSERELMTTSMVRSKSNVGFSKTSIHGRRASSKLSKTYSRSLTEMSETSLDSWSLTSYDGSEDTEIAKGGSVKSKKRKDKKGKKKLEESFASLTVASTEVVTWPSDKEAEPEGGKKKKKGKGKKGKKEKKGKKGKEETSEEQKIEEPVTEEVDVMAEIKRMKALAEAEAAGVEFVEEAKEDTKKKKKKKKKGKKGQKKLSKKEKAKLAAELAEKQRVDAEADAARLAAEEKIRLETERKLGIEKEKRETLEHQIRQEQLSKSCSFINKIYNYNFKVEQKEKEEDEWNLYVECRKLPDSSKCNLMNTYLHLWERELEDTTVEMAAERTNNVLKLLGELNYFIDTASGEELNYLENWRWVRLLFREHQAQSLDVATYRLLRNIEKHFHRIDIPTADFHYYDENFKLSLWLRVQLPIPLFNPRRPAKPRIEINFKTMQMSLLCPTVIECDAMAIRALYLSYDHLSDLSNSYEKPDVPEEYRYDLYDYCNQEWRAKLRYKYDHRIRKPKLPPPTESEIAEGEAVPVEEEEEPEIGPDDDIPAVPYQKLTPSASEFVLAQEEKDFVAIKKHLMTDIPENVINLRKFLILGGIYYVNLLYQPPQPQDFVTMEMTITPLYLPKQLEEVSFYVPYTPPAPPEPGVRRLPEEIEEEMKKQEEDFEKLIFITLTLPEHVIFLELPVVCIWDSENKCWTQKDVHDVKHNEEKGYLTFRSCRFGIFALATYRYSNFPFQAWELRPEVDETVTLQITAAILMLEFNVKDGMIALTQLQNSPNNAMQDIIGQYMKLPRLIKIMQSSGVDVFPAFDAFGYIEGTCEKHWPTEKHVYCNMALLSNSYNFSWSRWNQQAGRRKLVMQMREYNPEKSKQKSHSMLLVTPQFAQFIDCTDVSSTFNEEGIEGTKFCADLYYLMKVTSSISTRNKIENASKELVYALTQLLICTRVMSFS